MPTPVNCATAQRQRIPAADVSTAPSGKSNGAPIGVCVADVPLWVVDNSVCDAVSLYVTACTAAPMLGVGGGGSGVTVLGDPSTNEDVPGVVAVDSIGQAQLCGTRWGSTQRRRIRPTVDWRRRVGAAKTS